MLLFKEKMESQSETTQIVSALKLLVLKTGDYDLWSMRMEQYLTHTDYALWEVIMNGDAPAAIASASAGTEGPIPPKTAEQKLARKNELKAKSTRLLAIPDEKKIKTNDRLPHEKVHLCLENAWHQMNQVEIENGDLPRKNANLDTSTDKSLGCSRWDSGVNIGSFQAEEGITNCSMSYTPKDHQSSMHSDS
ncbi:hypothetical protein Tco_0881835 [Tanacetum coccineum]